MDRWQIELALDELLRKKQALTLAKINPAWLGPKITRLVEEYEETYEKCVVELLEAMNQAYVNGAKNNAR